MSKESFKSFARNHTELANYVVVFLFGGFMTTYSKLNLFGMIIFHRMFQLR